MKPVRFEITGLSWPFYDDFEHKDNSGNYYPEKDVQELIEAAKETLPRLDCYPVPIIAKEIQARLKRALARFEKGEEE